MTVIRIAIADDHPLILHGTSDFLSAADDIEVVAMCPDGTQALDAIRGLRPDVAVLDLSMPGLGGIEVLAALHADGLQTRVIFLSAFFASHEIMRAMAEGAEGFLPKDCDPNELLDCIRDVAAGKKHLPFELLDRTRAKESSSAQVIVRELLTDREWKVMALAAEGLSNKEIARKLHVTEGTAKIHLHNIFQKLGVSKRSALASLAFRYSNK